MALDHEFEAMAAQADRRPKKSAAERIKDGWRRKDNVHRAYRRLFLDADGNLRPDAVEVIADLSLMARLGVADLINEPAELLRERAGRRNIVLHLMGRLDLDGSRLRLLSRKLREGPNT